jgi:hypothetical protein
MTIHYTDDDINNIILNGFEFSFDKYVLEKIQKLSDQVGDPEYIRTPQFSKKSHKVSEEDWEAIRNFKKTEFIKKEGVAASSDIIRKYLNKLTIKTYKVLSVKIIDEIKSVCKSKNILDINSCEEDADINKIGVDIFAVASSGLFYSEMYAKLYILLMSEFNFMETLLRVNFADFRKVFRTIKYCDPNKDYDGFCDNNKANEKRRSLGLFYVNLMLHNAIEKDDIMDIIIELQNFFLENLEEEDRCSVVDELSELIFVMVKHCYVKCKKNGCDKWRLIFSNLKNISELNRGDMKSITNKTIFKHMDIMDIIRT